MIRIAEYKREWAEKNKERLKIKHALYWKNRWQEDPEYRNRTYERVKAARKTPRGKLTHTYQNMKKRVSGKDPKASQYAGMSILPHDEFINWGMNSKDYQDLFLVWEKSGYEQRLAPSIDRIDPTKGYDLNNIQWLTMSANTTKALNRRYGKV